MNLAYIRVSSVDQNEARQREALKKYNIERWYIDFASGKDLKRPKLQEMLDFMRDGDIVYIYDFSRISRNVKDLIEITDLFNKKKVHLVSEKENFDTSTPTGKLMLTMIGAINEFEREILLERQREGIAIAKAQGKYKGKQMVIPKEFDRLYAKYMRREIPTKSELARRLKISRPRLQRIINAKLEEERKSTNS